MAVPIWYAEEMEPAAVAESSHSFWTTESTAGYAMAMVEPVARAAQGPTSHRVSPRAGLGEVVAGDVDVDVVRRLGLERDLVRPVEHHGVHLLQPLDERRHLGRDHGERRHTEGAAHLCRRHHHQRPAAGPADHAPRPVVDGDLGQPEELLEGLPRLLRIATADDETLEANG